MSTSRPVTPGVDTQNAPNPWPELSYSALPPGSRLGDQEVHIFAVRLDISAAQQEALAALLSRPEWERAARFHFERDRRRFIACRSRLRTILGHYLSIRAEDVEFEYGPNGKPRLAASLAKGAVEFNVSHAREMALVAVVRQLQVGIDVEWVRHLDDAADLVARFFSTRENDAFQRVEPALRPAAFFNLWTRKEAWLKATGEGIGHRLHAVEVTFLPGEPARLLEIPADLGGLSHWSLHSLNPAPGYAGALAVESRKATMQSWALK